MVCLLLFGAGATIVAVKESINARCLYIPDLPITFLLFLASTLLNIYNFCERATNQLAALLLFGTLSLYTRTKHFEELQEESMEYRLLSAIVLNHIWYFVVLLAHFFSQFLVGNGVFS